MAFAVKEGDSAEWSTAKLGLPRHFTYWREPAVREVLTRIGWTVTSLDHVAGRTEPWLYVIAHTAQTPKPLHSTMAHRDNGPRLRVLSVA